VGLRLCELANQETNGVSRGKKHGVTQFGQSKHRDTKKTQTRKLIPQKGISSCCRGNGGPRSVNWMITCATLVTPFRGGIRYTGRGWRRWKKIPHRDRGEAKGNKHTQRGKMGLKVNQRNVQGKVGVRRGGPRGPFQKNTKTMSENSTTGCGIQTGRKVRGREKKAEKKQVKFSEDEGSLLVLGAWEEGSYLGDKGRKKQGLRKRRTTLGFRPAERKET